MLKKNSKRFHNASKISKYLESFKFCKKNGPESSKRYQKVREILGCSKKFRRF
jgi:hypothetical protein